MMSYFDVEEERKIWPSVARRAISSGKPIRYLMRWYESRCEGGPIPF